MPPRRAFDPDWPRISRWCLLGTFVMLVWLLAPVAKCSFTAFKDTPLSELDETTARPSDADAGRVERGKGFFQDWIAGVKVCYARTPLLGQEPWKRDLLLGFGGIAIAAWAIGKFQAAQRRTHT